MGDQQEGNGLLSQGDGHRRIVTVRAFVLGLLVCAGIAVVSTYTNTLAQTVSMGGSQIPLWLLVSFFAIVFVANPLLRVLRRSWPLRPGEIVLVFMMGWLSTRIGLNLRLIAAPYHLATPENRWEEYIIPYMPVHLLPTNERGEMATFFQGLPAGGTTPWGAWVPPLFWWFSMMGVGALVSLAVVVILRKQWVEHERLVFPLAEVPLQIISDVNQPGGIRRYLEAKLFWMGVGVPVFIAAINICGYFVPWMPRANLQPVVSRVYIARGFPRIFLGLDPVILGFAFFANSRILLSLWIFHLLAIIQVGIQNRLGLSVGSYDVWLPRDPAVAWQSYGGIVVFVILILWRARRHVLDTLKTAMGLRPRVDDSSEIMSYRSAWLIVVLGLIYLTAWMHKAGLEWGIALMYIVTVGILMIGMTRIIGETGLLFLGPTMIPQTFVARTLGSASMTHSSLGAAATGYGFMGYTQTYVMSPAAHSVKMLDRVGGNPRGVMNVLCAAMLVGGVVAAAYTIHLGYSHGAINFGGSHPDRVIKDVVAKVRNPEGTSYGRLAFFAVGGVVVSVLTLLTWRFPWWPLHPIGFTSSFVWQVRMAAASVFVAWLAKSIILWVGGIEGFRKARLFFIGLILGAVFATMMAVIIDLIFFPGAGHGLLWTTTITVPGATD